MNINRNYSKKLNAKNSKTKEHEITLFPAGAYRTDGTSCDIRAEIDDRIYNIELKREEANKMLAYLLNFLNDTAEDYAKRGSK